MRSYVLTVWNFLDPIYYFFNRLQCLPCKGNILRVRLTKYKGREIMLSDGTKINHNDFLVKIHLHNAKLLYELKEIKSELRRAKMIYRGMQNSLPELEKFRRRHPRREEIKGIIGITTLNKASTRLGFEVFDISHPLYRLFKTFAFLPIELLSNHNTSIKEIVKNHKPSYLFMSTNMLTERYRK